MVFWLHNAGFHLLCQSSKKRILKVAIFSLSFELMKISNEGNSAYLNFSTIFTPKMTQQNMQSLFNAQVFNTTFACPCNQRYSLTTNASLTDMQESIFGSITEEKSGVYNLTWTNKKNNNKKAFVIILKTKYSS